MWKDLPEEQRQEYKKMILAFASLSRNSICTPITLCDDILSIFPEQLQKGAC